MNWTQQDAPLMDALKEHLMNRVVRFDVPGHKGGRGNHELADFLGERCVQIDVNSMKNLDNLCHPVSVLRDAQQLAAEAFGAANAFFIINGATGASQAMIMSVCKAGEKLIMPRNVHRSAINALVVNGAVPVYVDPGENKDLGIPLGMSVEAVERAILANPDAKAVLVNNPTYYGVCPDIRRIAKLAHEHGMLLLADEAHGTHFYFGENLPCSAMAAGADMASVSIHKTGGSLTQSAMLLCAEGINADYVRQVINLTPNNERLLPAHGFPGYCKAKSGAERQRNVPESGAVCRLCTGRNQPHRRVLCLRGRTVQRRFVLCVRPDKIVNSYPKHGSGRHRSV